MKTDIPGCASVSAGIIFPRAENDAVGITCMTASPDLKAEKDILSWFEGADHSLPGIGIHFIITW